MRKTVRSITFLGALATASLVMGQSADSELTERQVGNLPPEAREVYEEAMALDDVGDLAQSTLSLSEAGSLAPNNKDLQFVIASRALFLVDHYYSAATFREVPENIDYSSPPWRTAEVFIEVTEEAVGRLNQISGITDVEQLRLESQQEAIEELKAEMPERDAARMETGFAFAQQIADRRRQEFLDRFGGSLDPLNPFAQQEMTRLFGEQGTEEEELEEEEGPDDPVAFNESDPFATLPGEYIPNFLPPPQQNQGGRGGRFQGNDPFGGGGGEFTGFPGGPPAGTQPQPQPGAGGGEDNPFAGGGGGGAGGGDPFAGGGGGAGGGDPFAGGGGGGNAGGGDRFRGGPPRK